MRRAPGILLGLVMMEGCLRAAMAPGVRWVTPSPAARMHRRPVPVPPTLPTIAVPATEIAQPSTSGADDEEWRLAAAAVAEKERVRRACCVLPIVDVDLLRVDLTLSEATCSEILDALRGQHVAIDIENHLGWERATVDLRGVLVRAAMDWLVGRFAIAYEVKENRVIVTRESEFETEIRGLLEAGLSAFRAGRSNEARACFEEAFQKKPPSEVMRSFVRRHPTELEFMQEGTDEGLRQDCNRIVELSKPGK